MKTDKLNKTNIISDQKLIKEIERFLGREIEKVHEFRADYKPDYHGSYLIGDESRAVSHRFGREAFSLTPHAGVMRGFAVNDFYVIHRPKGHRNQRISQCKRIKVGYKLPTTKCKGGYYYRIEVVDTSVLKAE